MRPYGEKRVWGRGGGRGAEEIMGGGGEII